MWLAYLVLFVLLSPGVIFTVPMGKKMGGRVGVVLAHAVVFVLAVNLLNVYEGFQWVTNERPQQKKTAPAKQPVKQAQKLGLISPAARQQQAQQQLNQAENEFNSAKTQYQNALNTFNSNINIVKSTLNQMTSQVEQTGQLGIRLSENIASPTPKAINTDVSVAQSSSDPLVSTTKNLISTQTKLGNDSKNLATLRQKYNAALQAVTTAKANLAKIPGAEPPPQQNYGLGRLPSPDANTQTGSSGLFGAIADMSSRMTLTTPTGLPSVVRCGQGQYTYNIGDGNTMCAPCTYNKSTGNPAVDSENSNSMLSSCI